MKKKTITWLSIMILSLPALSAGGVNERLIGTDETIVGPALESGAGTGTEEQEDISEILYSVGNLYAFIENNFLYEIDNREIEEGLMAGLIEGLGDRYSYYVPASEAEEHNEEVLGEYVGIGTYVSKMNPKFIEPTDPETYMLKIVSPFPGGPADRAGLLPGDMISHINDEELTYMDAYEASRKLRGRKGEPLKLTVYRNRNSFELNVIPEEVKTPSTASTMIDGRIGYLAITNFMANTANDALGILEGFMDQGMEGLIIDLRNNGGGLVDTSLGILNMLLPKGSDMITVEYSKKSKRPSLTYKSGMDPVVPEDIPVIVLVNEGTASASEIMTGCLRDNGRATILGTKTFGKGIIQEQYPYKDGGLVNITVAKYLTPDGSEIHEVGIEPDIIVEMPEFTEEENKAYFEFADTGKYREWVDVHPEMTEENIDLFIETYEDTGVPYDMLYLLVKKEYLYRMPASERPVVDLVEDRQLLRALEEIGK